MACLGQDRHIEIERVERVLKSVLRTHTIRNAANLSYFEVYAAALRAIESIARMPAEELREQARLVTDKWGAQ